MSIYVKPGGKPDWAVRAEGWVTPSTAALIAELRTAVVDEVEIFAGNRIAAEVPGPGRYYVVRIDGEET